MTGAFYRIAPEETGAGTVYWQEKPNAPLALLVDGQAVAYENVGRWVDLSAKDMAALLKALGTV